MKPPERSKPPSFERRVSLAIGAFFSLLGDAAFAARYEALRAGAASQPTPPPARYDAAAVRLTGQVVGQPPDAGGLSHRGWRVTEMRLPQLAERHDARVIAPAEVEL